MRLLRSCLLSGIVALVAGCSSAAPPSATQSQTPAKSTPTAPTPTPAPTQTILELADSGTMFPGVYRTRFEPAMTITINRLVDLDCSPGYKCRGDIDVNLPQWVAFEFGNVHGSELDISRLDKVVAADGKTPVDPPEDLAAWLVLRPGMKTLAGPVPVVVGGIAGTQLDLVASRATSFGPTGLPEPADFGVNPGAQFRAVVLKVAGHWVMITETFGPDNTERDFDLVVKGLQSVVDSITWN